MPTLMFDPDIASPRQKTLEIIDLYLLLFIIFYSVDRDIEIGLAQNNNNETK